MPVYSYDHIHLRSRDPMATAQYYQKMFDAKIIESIQSDGQPRIDLDINGLTVFLARVPVDAKIGEAPVDPHLGLDHFGLRGRQPRRRVCRAETAWGRLRVWNHARSAPASRSPSCAGQTTSALSCWNGLDSSLWTANPVRSSSLSPPGEGQVRGVACL